MEEKGKRWYNDREEIARRWRERRERGEGEKWRGKRGVRRKREDGERRKRGEGEKMERK